MYEVKKMNVLRNDFVLKYSEFPNEEIILVNEIFKRVFKFI